MTDRDRLIDLSIKAKLYAQEKADERGGLVCIDDEVDYLLANGIIVPPCRVGDTVYVIYPDPRYNWGNKELKILELKVHAFRYFNNIMTVEIRGDGNYITWDISCFGVSVFLTPEEAEKALEGYKENM